VPVHGNATVAGLRLEWRLRLVGDGTVADRNRETTPRRRSYTRDQSRCKIGVQESFPVPPEPAGAEAQTFFTILRHG
jgi:hypothetical protein